MLGEHSKKRELSASDSSPEPYNNKRAKPSTTSAATNAAPACSIDQPTEERPFHFSASNYTTYSRPLNPRLFEHAWYTTPLIAAIGADMKAMQANSRHYIANPTTKKKTYGSSAYNEAEKLFFWLKRGQDYEKLKREGTEQIQEQSAEEDSFAALVPRNPSIPCTTSSNSKQSRRRSRRARTRLEATRSSGGCWF